MLQAIVLGTVQGLAEFLPVSSSAHLILIPRLAGWSAMGIEFDVALHFGTTLAVIAYFFSDLWRMIGGLARLALGKADEAQAAAGRLALWIGLSMVPAGFAGIFLKKQIESVRENFLLIAAMLVIVGLLLYRADRARGLERGIESIGGKEAILIGLAQATALVPGVSRSGATMLTALFLGFRRDEAARFSFLMAVPVISGGALLAAKDLLETTVAPDYYLQMAAGVLASAVAGFLCIKYFLAFLRRGGFTPFAIYRVVFGATLCAWFLLKS